MSRHLFRFDQKLNAINCRRNRVEVMECRGCLFPQLTARYNSRRDPRFVAKSLRRQGQAPYIFLLVPLHHDKTAGHCQDVGRGLHSNEIACLAAGQGIIRAVVAFPVGRLVGAAAICHARMFSELHNQSRAAPPIASARVCFRPPGAAV